MLNNNYALKYKTTYKGQFEITHCWTNVTVTLQYGATEIRYNIRHIHPIQFVLDINFEN